MAAIKAVAGLPLPGTPNLTPNFGDLEAWRNWPDAAFDLLVGGTPCQSFSVAGLRQGLDDPRGNLALVYLGVADRYRPRWLVWENVPGVLSSGKGRDFGAFLGGLGELGYGWAYRVLDACLMTLVAPARVWSQCPPRHSWRALAAAGSLDARSEKDRY
jgi:DNA (cytosine-5)-methyltransferase 1